MKPPTVDHKPIMLKISAGEEVSFHDKFLGDDSILELCEKLKITPKKRLILRGNQLSSNGAQAISQLISSQNALDYLSLEWNHVGSSGAIYLAEALKSNSSLTHLDLRNNRVDNDAALALAESLASNDYLRKLDIRWNNIEDSGALAFKSAILQRKPPLTILLTGNQISANVMTTINEWQEQATHPIEPPPPREDEEPPKNIQFAYLTKEVQLLRLQLSASMAAQADLQRQNDQSAIKITELEQQINRETYQTASLSNALKEAMFRNSTLTDERTAVQIAWERERAELMAEMTQVARDKENALKDMTIECDNLRDQYERIADENSQIRLQFEHLQEQVASDRAVSLNELRNSTMRLNESVLSETKLKAGVNSMRNTMQRQQDRIRLLEEEIEIHRREHTRDLQAAQDQCNVEIERLKTEHATMMNALLERNVAQNKEMSALHALITTLRSEITVQRQELQDAYDMTLKEVKEIERKRAEELMIDLRQRLELLAAARNELESRCGNYTSELKEQQAAHERITHQLQQQLESLQEELNRLRNQNGNLRAMALTMESAATERQDELLELRSKYSTLEIESQSWHQELQQAVNTRQKLAERLQKVEKKYAALQESREKEFHMVMENTMQTMREQFENMRVTLRISNDSNAAAAGGDSMSQQSSPNRY